MLSVGHHEAFAAEVYVEGGGIMQGAMLGTISSCPQHTSHPKRFIHQVTLITMTADLISPEETK